MDIAQLNDENVFLMHFFYKNEFYVYCWNDGMFTVGMIAFLNLSSSPSSTRKRMSICVLKNLLLTKTFPRVIFGLMEPKR